MTRETRTLPVRLTDEEVETKTKELVAKLDDYNKIETQKKFSTKALGDQLKATRAEVDKLARVVADRKEPREVECYREQNLPRKIWEVRRSDTGEVVEQVAMSSYELEEARQLDLERMPLRETQAEQSKDF